MKPRHYWTILIPLLLLAAAVLQPPNQVSRASSPSSAALEPGGAKYDLSWMTIDSGGGSSQSGAYQMTGALGQPETGPTLSGGGYRLEGGFWHRSTGGGIYLPLVVR